MNDIEKQHFLHSWNRLLSDIEPLEIINHLYQNNVISTIQYETIHALPNRPKRIQMLLVNVYSSRTDKTFNKFTEALSECDCKHIADELMKPIEAPHGK